LEVVGSWQLAVGSWQVVALGYISYLAAVSLTRRDFARVRPVLLIAAAVAWGAFALRRGLPLSPVLSVVVPSIVLLAGYWLSGLLFVRPNLPLERWLHAVDDRVLIRSGVLERYRHSPDAVQAFFELSYLLVYVAVPAGATTVIVSGHPEHVDRFWTVVLLAEFVCYGMLPWLQTRPPRALEPAGDTRIGGVRRLNLRLVNQASIQVNTLPSGHAAGAFATALAIVSISPIAGGAFMLLALSISIATVVGRYHYVVDTVLGALVALAVWLMV
jgi:membrane-associated phospholipid phosphatase